MLRAALAFVLVGALAGVSLDAGLGQSPSAPTSGRTLLDRYCVTCHNEKTRTGGLSLGGLDPASVDAHAETWEKVVRKLRSGSMPPPGLPRPDRASTDAFAA